jgi:OCT family organic cation transporter-like MFS transporter 18
LFLNSKSIVSSVYGRIGDVMGERVPLILAFSSAFLSYFLMGIADNLTVLFLSRLPSVLMHVMQGIYFYGSF